jgi:hypothetical protein
VIDYDPGWAIVPLGPPAEIKLDALAPLVRELASWLEPGEWPPTLAGLIRCAPPGLFDELRAQLAGPLVPVPWTLNAIVRHALLPLAELSLMDGQPVIPELGAALVDVLADPRLGPSQRREVEVALIDSEDLAGELEAEARGRSEHR